MGLNMFETKCKCGCKGGHELHPANGISALHRLHPHN